MNDFEERLNEAGANRYLHGSEIDTIQVNVGLKCNQSCVHCHLGASPSRTEMMEWPTMELILEAVENNECRLIDITGGAPELNPHLTRFIKALHEKNGRQLQVRTNLTALLESGMEKMPEFYRDHNVQLVASMPCYLEENVRAQRGPLAYEKSVEAMSRLNRLGYGIEPDLQLNLVYNPGGAVLPPDQISLEADYRRELGERFGIKFTRLLTITNMPIGKFRTQLQKQDKENEYINLLKTSFNPETLDALMCRHQVSVGWDGTLYDCDFNLALGMPVDAHAPEHISHFDYSALANRKIITAEHCYGCTAGSGSSCSGALL